MMTIWLTFAYIYQWGNNPIDVYNYVLFLLLFVGILSGFYGMTVTVTDKHLIIKFGIGIYSKKIDLGTIRSAAVQKFPVYYGYGIRFLPNGILYNVSGKHAVEIRFKNKSSVIQIGTNDRDNLKDAIETSI